MEKIQVIEVLWRYVTLPMILIFIGYLISYIGLNLIRDKSNTKLSIFVNEVHILSRSLLLIMITFIFAKHMIYVQIGAEAYFKLNPTHNYTNFFRYILEISQVNHHK